MHPWLPRRRSSATLARRVPPAWAGPSSPESLRPWVRAQPAQTAGWWVATPVAPERPASRETLPSRSARAWSRAAGRPCPSVAGGPRGAPRPKLGRRAASRSSRRVLPVGPLDGQAERPVLDLHGSRPPRREQVARSGVEAAVCARLASTSPVQRVSALPAWSLAAWRRLAARPLERAPRRAGPDPVIAAVRAVPWRPVAWAGRPWRAEEQPCRHLEPVPGGPACSRLWPSCR